MNLLFGSAILLALAVLGLRLIRQRIRERARPGSRPTTAIEVEDYGDIDLTVRMQVCSCGGRFILRGEGPAPEASRPLRVAHLECRRCERERRVYFDLASIRH